MANENLEILEGSGTPKRLGKLPAKARRQALQFADFYKFLNLPPASTYWQKKTPIALRHYGNLQYGDCTIASQANAQTRFQRQERHPITVSDEEVIRVYQNMSDRLYGGGDNGAYENDALDNWRDADLTFRDSKGHPQTIQAYLAINVKNLDEVRAAIALSAGKGIKICFALPAAYSATDPPATWDVPADGRFTGAWMPGSWGGHCAAGNTKIPLLNGENVPIKDLVGEERLWIYGALPTSQPVPACASGVIRTRKARTLRVSIDDGTAVKTTPEHLFMLRDGSYRQAQHLQPGDRLMPLRRIVHHRGYEKVKWYDGGKRQAFTHRMVAEHVLGAGRQDATHHVDENKRNNDPSNLKIGSQADHVRLHKPWLTSPMTYTHGWFSTPAGREWVRRPRVGKHVPASENHKVVAVEPSVEQWTYDLVGVSPTSNFAAGSVFIHNSLFMNGYTKAGGILDHTWELPNNVVTWDAIAAYADEGHLVMDSLDNWKSQVKAQTAVKFSLADVRDAVNSVSNITI